MIFGSDDRVSASAIGANTSLLPLSALVRLEVTYPNGLSTHATGVLIGPNDVLTVAHALYSPENGGYATRVVASPGQNGASKPFGSAEGITAYVDQRWISNTNNPDPFVRFDYDYGVLTLDRDIGNAAGYLPVTAIANPIGVFVTSPGYPADRGGTAIYYTAGTADGGDVNTLYFQDDLDLSPGQSVSPVLFPAANGFPQVGGLISFDSPPAYNGILRISTEYASNITFWATHNDETAGPDAIFGGDLSEIWDGEAGNDTIVGMAGNDTIFGDFGDDDLNGNTGNDLVSGDQGADFVRGGQGNDVVFGDDGDDWHVNGNIGDDFVFGGGGNDTVHGGPNSDWLEGGDGRDVLSGDLGNDTLVGGAGADLFYFGFGSGTDVILDFDLSQDRLFLETTYTKFAAQNGTYIDLGGGHGFTVVGVTPGQLSDFYFL